MSEKPSEVRQTKQIKQAKQTVRRPAVADRFYPGSAADLRETIGRLLVEKVVPPGPSPVHPSPEQVTRPEKTTATEKGLAVISPHAGYVYSGALAARTLASVTIPEAVVLLGPNHRGSGAPVALSTAHWQTPLGLVPADSQFHPTLLAHAPMVQIDEAAHAAEHSLEVQLPFLQYLGGPLRITPLLLSHLGYPACVQLAEGLAAAIQADGSDRLLLASTDMSHYESRQSAEGKDHLALQAIADLDPEGLYHTVFAHRISMCGVIPVVVALLAAKLLGASRSRLIGYTDSGYVSGISREVVGYAGIVIN